MANQTQHHDEEAFRRLLHSMGPDTALPPGYEERLLLRLKAHIRAGQTSPDRKPRIPRRYVWAFRLIPAGAAAVLAVIAAWWLTGHVSTAAADFAEMLRRVRQATTVAYDQILLIPGQPETRMHVLMAQHGRAHVTFPDGKISVVAAGEGSGLVLFPTRKARLVRLAPGAPHDDPLENLRRTDGSAGRFIGKEMLDRREVAVYQVPQPQGSMKVWLDRRDELPVRIEVRSSMRDGREAVAVLENLSWYQPLPDSLFSLEVPPGYALERLEEGPTEGALVDLLRACAQMNGGVFPPRLDSRVVLDLVFESHPETDPYQMGTDGIPHITHTDGSDDHAKETYRACMRGLAFVEQAGENGSWRYVGDGVSLGDAAAAVCWWRPPAAALFRVVYGDLSIKDAAPDEVPLPPGASASQPMEKESSRE